MFLCTHCDAQSLKWSGRCVTCGQWGTVFDEAEVPEKAGQSRSKGTKSRPAVTLNLAAATTAIVQRQSTNISELDRVLGGGLVPGSVTLLAGEPGIGKSTLVAQLAASFTSSLPPLSSPTAARRAPSKGGGDVKNSYYASGEESEGQVRLRFVRLGLDPAHVVFSNATETGSIIAAAEAMKPSIVIVDSIQTMMTEGVESFPGTPTAVRAATSELISYAKASNVPVLIIGQVTKDGIVAGPKTLEHLVDTVLTLEGDATSAYRLLRASKNRFGSVEDVGVFAMTEKGMVPVENPSAMFLKERVDGPGSVVTCIMEGNRPFLVEIQALIDKSFFPNPVRRTSGYDVGRLQMLLAILSKRAGVRLYDQDVYVNVVGGLKLDEPSADLAVAAAILSAIDNVTFPAKTIVIGELGLGGEVRSVAFSERRRKEAERLGFGTILDPKSIKTVSELRAKMK
ncbi:MAG: AAA family ATPase [Patescibacteria group bacterium]